MDVGNCNSQRRARKEAAAAESALDPVASCAHLELGLRYHELSYVKTNARETSVGHEKFGVEDDFLYDFRDYGLD